MSNSLTPLIPTLIGALQRVLRESVGFIPAVTTDFSDEKAAVNQTINLPIADVAVNYNIAPSNVPPNGTDTTATNRTLTISNSQANSFHLTGEELLGMEKNGPAYRSKKIEQGFRSLTNAVELSIAQAAQIASAYAFGTAGTTGCASSLTDLFTLDKLLNDNAAPPGDRHLVINSALKLNIGSLTQLTNVNQAGDETLLREAKLGMLAGMDLHFSQQIQTPASGTGSAYVTSGSSAIGATSVVLVTGSGTVIAGDVVTFAGDSNKYMVSVGVAAPGTITLQNPLKTTVSTGTAMTVAAKSTRNFAFDRSAIILAARQPEMPEGGDMADDVVSMFDEFSGLTFQVALYRQYRQISIEIGLAWGCAVWQPETLITYLG